MHINQASKNIGEAMNENEFEYNGKVYVAKDVVFSENHGWRDCQDEKGSRAKIITKSDWLAATDNMQVKDEQ